MTKDEYIEIHVALCDKARELSIRKNQDYASDEDPFRNFRLFGGLGFLVRMSDKLSRLRTYEERGTLVNETVHDTLLDLINYVCLYGAFIMEREYRKEKV